METKKKYVYDYNRKCEICSKEYVTTRYSSKTCSDECNRLLLAKKKRKYTDEQINKAIEMKLAGFSTKDIEKETTIKKPTQHQIFKEKNINLTEEQTQNLLKNRWKDHNPIQDGKKECSKCGLLKPLEEFHKNNNRLAGVVSSCKECYSMHYDENSKEIKKRNKEYRLNNPEKNKENSQKLYEKKQEYYKENAARWAANNPEKRKEIEKKYRENNQPQKNARTAAYRAKKKQAMPKWLSDAQKLEISLFYKNCPKGYHIDHIVPISGEDVCGLHVPWNLQYLLGYLNESKGNHFIDKIDLPAVCHQYTRKLETIEEDTDDGMPIGCDLNEFTFSFEDSTKEHRDFIERYEWLGTVGYSPKWIFTARINGILGGVVIISEPNAYTLDKTLEALISRGATASWTPKNLGSKLLMFACRWMLKNTEKRVFFGYSDHQAGEIGTIYQACNFKYLGMHFGARSVWTLENDKKVSERYFSKTSTYKKYAKELGILWSPNWLKENGYMDKKKIPLSIIKLFKEKSFQEKQTAIKIPVMSKSKYVLFMGSNKKEEQDLINKYLVSRFGEFLPYPKRSNLSP